MNRRIESSSEQVFLGIEAGGTRTVAAATPCGAEAGSDEHRTGLRMESGPANLRLLNDGQLTRHFEEIAKMMPSPVSIAIGMAGTRTESDRERIRKTAAKVWPGVPCYATNDLETALMAGGEEGREDRGQKTEVRGQRSESREQRAKGKDRTAEVRVRVLVLSGTGSCCFGRTPAGRSAKVGGWGHLLGDKGSGYEIGLRALKAAVYYYDCDGAWSALGQRMLRVLQLNEPDDLIGWAQTASKMEIAALAVEVFKAAAKRETIALDILAGAASSLAGDAAACAARLVKPGTPVQFIFAGSVLLKQPRFAKQVSLRLQKCWPNSAVTPLKGESVWGAVELARRLFAKSKLRPRFHVHALKSKTDRMSEIVSRDDRVAQSLLLSPTEQRNPLSMNLDKLPLAEAIALMLREDEKIPAALLRERSKLEQTIRLVVRAFRRGGRLFYVGAGTSGRLGVLDASECPPTFRTAPEMVQGIIAGGQRALWESVEGAEDDPGAGAGAIGFRGLSRRDVVVGIAASGRTPFVWGALREAKRRGAATVLLCFNPGVRIPPQDRPKVLIAANVGPEVLTGSTRLKAGTATKLILNMITTLAMVRLGKVRGNLMIDVNASNTKLRDRATRIVRELTGADYGTARAALEKAGWKIQPACRGIATSSSRWPEVSPATPGWRRSGRGR